MAPRRSRSGFTRKNRNSKRRVARAGKKIKFSRPYRPAPGTRIRFSRWKTPKGNWSSSKCRF